MGEESLQLEYSNGTLVWSNNDGYATSINISDEFNTKVNSIQNCLEYEINELKDKLKNMNKHISLIHNCANCGATLNIEENKPVFHCKYCGSAYLIGTAQIYSNY